MFGIAEARGAETSSGEMADIPADTSEIPTICEKRPRSSTDTSPSSTTTTRTTTTAARTSPPPYKRQKSHDMVASSQNGSTPSSQNGRQLLSTANFDHHTDDEGIEVINNEVTKKFELKELRVYLKDIKKLDGNMTLNNIPPIVDNRNIFVVEKILDKKQKNNQIFYYIKWQGWSTEHNTWEPADNLYECEDIIEIFERERGKLLEKFKKKEDYFPTMQNIDMYLKNKIIQNKKHIVNLKSDDDALYHSLKLYFSSTTESLDTNDINDLKEKIKKLILHSMLCSTRNDQLESLQDWESEINSITKERPLIQVENDVDLECAPQDFYYIQDYLPGSGVIIPDEPPIGCECKNCDSKSNCCYSQYDGTIPYTNTGRVRVPPGTPIYECNKRCKCSPICQNRVVQRGSNVDLCIFRTKNGRGWGVKTLKLIKKGTFITQYVGEVITNEEAEKRGQKYDAAGRTYLFDLDYNEIEDQCPYTVDAATYGNVSHFINHSCDPNSAVYGVWIDCLDPNLPKLALFASREIKKNEEITFDYMRPSAKTVDRLKRNSPVKNGDADDLNVSIESRQRLELPGKSECDIDNELINRRTRCKCGAKCCRQYLF